MRTYTLFVSIAVHLAIVGAAFVVPIVATNTLPAPRRSITFVVATAPLPPPPVVTVRRPDRVASPDAAPTKEPETIQPETPRPVPIPMDPGIDDVFRGVPGGLRMGLSSALNDAPLPPPPPVSRPTPPMPVGGVIRPPQRLHDVAPRYPTIARSAGIAGVVILEAVIAEDGTVRDVKVLRSVPLLDQAAVDAVRQWRFTPTLLNGQAIPIVMTVTVAFTLG